jgi:DNA polymerase-3 subunit epsilon
MSGLKYAIVDIETTGGFASGNHIIEICIIVTDGKQELDRLDSLIFLGVGVPRFITGFTGITQDMLDAASPFKAVAKRIYEILYDCMFVAHSVNFDDSFVKKGTR